MNASEQRTEAIERASYVQEPRDVNSCSPLLTHDPNSTTHTDDSFTAWLLMVLPLACHLIGSLVVAAALLYYLDGRQFYLERQPRVRLADGTYQSQRLARYSLLQPEVTTVLSVWLMILRWVAALWAVPLCWRAIFVLAETSGVRYQDISWATNYGILYPSTHFRRPVNLILGAILIFTLAPQPSAPLLTGSISWVPSNRTIDLPGHPNITIAGISQDPSSPIANIYSPFRESDSYSTATLVVKNFNTAWTQDIEEFTFKRVITAKAHLSIGSTLDSVMLSYLSVSRIEWLSQISNDSIQQLMNVRDGNHELYDQMGFPGAAVLLPGLLETDMVNPVWSYTWPILIQVGTDPSSRDPASEFCDSSNTFFPAGTSIPYFYLHVKHNASLSMSGCFAHASISFNTGYGICTNCRIGSFSTVQNDTELQLMPTMLYQTPLILAHALRNMLTLLPLMTPLRDSLPDPTVDLEIYVTALLTRIYSTLFNSYADLIYDEGPWTTTGYKPLVPMLRAEINRTRVYAWLGLQLAFTFSGVCFVWLQSRSRYQLIGDTDMVAFDIDSTEVTKPGPSHKHASHETLRVERNEKGWKFTIAQ